MTFDFNTSRNILLLKTCLKHGVNYSSCDTMGGSCVGDANTSTFRLPVTFFSVTFWHELKGKLALFFLGHRWNDGL